jgi:hypothetical protein
LQVEFTRKRLEVRVGTMGGGDEGKPPPLASGTPFPKGGKDDGRRTGDW